MIKLTSNQDKLDAIKSASVCFVRTKRLGSVEITKRVAKELVSKRIPTVEWDAQHKHLVLS